MSFLRSLFGGGPSVAEREVQRRLVTFRGEIAIARERVEAAGGAGADALERLRTRPAELGLSADEAELETELLEAAIDVAALRAAVARGEALPVVPTSHRAVSGEVCYLVASASRPDVPGDQGGRLFLTDRHLVHLGSPTLRFGWAHVASVREIDRDLVVRRRSGEVHALRCNSYGDLLKAVFIASRMLNRGQPQG